jgi:hypothetical protein
MKIFPEYLICFFPTCESLGTTALHQIKKTGFRIATKKRF